MEIRRGMGLRVPSCWTWLCHPRLHYLDKVSVDGGLFLISETWVKCRIPSLSLASAPHLLPCKHQFLITSIYMFMLTYAHMYPCNCICSPI